MAKPTATARSGRRVRSRPSRASRAVATKPGSSRSSVRQWRRDAELREPGVVPVLTRRYDIDEQQKIFDEPFLIKGTQRDVAKLERQPLGVHAHMSTR